MLFDGPVDTGRRTTSCPPTLLATLREALTNVAKHARASSVDVTLRATDSSLELSVADDGRGLAASSEDRDIDASGGHGLVNLEKRATRWGGTFAAADGPGGDGTVVTWTVPRR